MTVEVRTGRDERLRLRPGVFLATDQDRLILFRREPWHRSASFGAPTAGKRATLARLAEQSWSALDLEAGTSSADDDLRAFVPALRAGGWLVTTVCHEGRDLYSLQPVDVAADPPDYGTDDLTLCRFAVLRREGDELLVESPLARARLLVHDAAVAATVADFAQGGAGTNSSMPLPVREALLADLARVGLAVPRAVDDEPDLRLWNPPELWLHGRSRMGSGGYKGGFGRTGWAAPYVEPAVEPAQGGGRVIDLYRPELAALEHADRSFTAVLEERRSIRAHNDDEPITVGQLGELLYRCAAQRTMTDDEGGAELAVRTYPSGGGMYELELYPVVRHVDGLSPGMYRYDPQAHQLRLVRGPGVEVDRLLQGAMWSSMAPGRPQVLIVLAARFGRLTSTYEELGYSLILKHVGVLYQTLYLVSTAMGLAPCGLGAGDARAFTDAVALAYPAESSVGEFMVGSRNPQ